MKSFLKGNYRGATTLGHSIKETLLLVPAGKTLNIIFIIIQHIDTLPKYGQKTLDVRRST